MGDGRGRALVAALSLFILTASAWPAFAATLTTVTVTQVGSGSRITLGFDAPFEAPERFALAAPERLVFDLPAGRAENRTYEGAGLVSSVRTAQFDNHTARVVLDLTGPAILAGSSADGRSMTVDIASANTTEFAKLVTSGRQELVGTVVSAPAPAPVEVAKPRFVPPPRPVPAPAAVE
ncbi:MAG: AMIN domain-containing protein, partial [Pacificimonas sp.]